MADMLREKELEVRSLRLILGGVLQMIGELSEALTYDAEMLPSIFKKLEQMSVELKEAEDAAWSEREKLMSEVSKWFNPEQIENKESDTEL